LPQTNLQTRMETNVLIPTLATHLATAIQSFDFEVSVNLTIESEKDTVHLRELELEIVCDVLGEQDHGNDVKVYHLAFLIRLKGDNIMYEEMAAIGTDPEESMNQGAYTFFRGFLTGFFQCLLGYYEPVYELKSPTGDEFHLNYSHLQVQGAFMDDMEEHHDNTFPDILYPAIKEVFEREITEPDHDYKDFYWIKIYLSRQPGGKFIGECRFDNNIWDYALNELIEYDYKLWKETDRFLGKKQFIFIRRCPK
jgi:hypothetical protein